MVEDQGWYNDDTATFGDRLAAAREAAGLSQSSFANKLGVKPTTVESWENDTKEPRANRLQMMSGILSVSMSWLLTGAGEGPDAPDAATELSDNVLDLLSEMRLLRGKITRAGEKLGRLEKRLRAALKEQE